MDLLFIVVSIYFGIGVVFWFHAMRCFSVRRALSIFPGMSPVQASVVTCVVALVVVLLVWPLVCLDK